MTRFQWTFLALVCAQAAHSLEEYAGSLWQVFAPARYFSGLVSPDLELGFIVINTTLVAFGLWCFLWPVRRRWPSATVFVGFWVVIELINGIGHPLWSLSRRSYTPGLVTSILLLVLAASLAIQLTRSGSAPASIRSGSRP